MSTGGITLSLNEGQMRDALNQAILAQLDGPMREKVLAEAIAHLTAASSGSGGYMSDRRSPLQKAFDAALDQAAYAIAHEYVASNEGFRAAIRAEIERAAFVALRDSERLRKVITDAVVRSMMELREPDERD